MVGWLDIVLGVILAATFVIGLVKGLVKEIVGVAAVIVGFIAASHFYLRPAAFFQRLVHYPVAAKFLGFIVIFAGFVMVGWLVAFLLSKLMVGPLRLLNHVFGGMVGLVEGMLISGVFVFALLVFPINKRALADSRLAPYCYGLAKTMVQLIPEDLKNQFREAYRNIVKSEGKNGQKI